MSVTLSEFEKLDIRICKVLDAERIPGKVNLFKLRVNLGSSETQVVAGGGTYYEAEYFVGKNFAILVNLVPKVISGIESRGMLLAADDKSKPVWLAVPDDVPPGTTVH